MRERSFNDVIETFGLAYADQGTRELLSVRAISDTAPKDYAYGGFA
jgi:hypothetical protein